MSDNEITPLVASRAASAIITAQEQEIERLRAFVAAWDALEKARSDFARRERLRLTYAQVNAEFERAAIALERAREAVGPCS